MADHNLLYIYTIQKFGVIIELKALSAFKFVLPYTL